MNKIYLNDSHQSNDETKPFIGYYGYWVILTYLSIISALFGIYFAFEGSIRNAIICIMISGICDTFDGRIARLKKRSNRELNYGVQIDAMADLISFAALPATIGYAIGESYGSFGTINAVISATYVLSALIRLSYFNATETELQEKNESRTYFEGLPTTSVALLIPSVYSICNILQAPFFRVYNVMLILISILFVLRIKIPKPKARGQIILCLMGMPIIIYILFFGGM